MVELWFSSRQIVREAIKFLRNAAQFLRHVWLDGHFRQLPSMVSFCVVVEHGQLLHTVHTDETPLTGERSARRMA